MNIYIQNQMKNEHLLCTFNTCSRLLRFTFFFLFVLLFLFYLLIFVFKSTRPPLQSSDRVKQLNTLVAPRRKKEEKEKEEKKEKETSFSPGC